MIKLYIYLYIIVPYQFVNLLPLVIMSFGMLLSLICKLLLFVIKKMVKCLECNARLISTFWYFQQIYDGLKSLSQLLTYPQTKVK